MCAACGFRMRLRINETDFSGMKPGNTTLATLFFLSVFTINGAELLLRDGTLHSGVIVRENAEYFLIDEGGTPREISKHLVAKVNGVTYGGVVVSPQTSVKGGAVSKGDEQNSAVSSARINIIPAPRPGFVAAKESRASSATTLPATGPVVAAPTVAPPDTSTQPQTSDNSIRVIPYPKKTVRQPAGSAQVESPVRSSPNVLPNTPMSALPQAVEQKYRPRIDGKTELVLKNGTVFIGHILSQSDHVINFLSENATVTIFKRHISTIDGKRFVYTRSEEENRTADSSTLNTSALKSGQSTARGFEGRSLFRELPSVGFYEGLQVSELVDSIRFKDDWRCRSRAARTLGLMGPWAVVAVDNLAVLMNDATVNDIEIPLVIDSADVPALLAPPLEAARALARLGKHGEAQLVKAAKSANPVLRCRALFGLGDCFLESSETVVRSALKDSDPSVRRVALSSLRRHSALTHLLVALRDPDFNVRSAAVMLCGHLGERSVAGNVILLSKDNNRAVRSSVAECLGLLATSEAVAALVELSRDSDSGVRAAAVRSLGMARDNGAVDALLHALRDQTAEVRAYAVEALGTLRDSRSIPSLYAMVKDSNETVRGKACAALKGLTELPLLVTALNDESPAVRFNAAYVLWLMTGQDFGVDKEKWEIWISKSEGKPPSD